MSGPHVDKDEQRRILTARTARLRSELDDERVPLSSADHAPTALRADWSVALDVICEEVVHARYVQVHEGYRPSYGCLVVPDIADVLAAGTTTIIAGGQTTADTQPSSTDDMRVIIDGHHIFLLRDLHGRAVVAAIEAEDELTLLQHTHALSAVAVQRLSDGRIKLVMEDIVCVNDGFDWRWLVTAGSMLPTIIEHLRLPRERLEDVASQLGRLLDLCVHLLSPRGIGATLVWKVGTPEPHGALSNNPNTPPAPLNFFDPENRPAIVSLLASVDGACAVSAEGDLTTYWGMLDPSADAKRIVSEQGGTRHTSAKRYSFDEPGSLVFVVSADGPVTIFSDGGRMAHFEDESATSRGPRWATELSLDDSSRVSTSETEFSCSTCGKQLRLAVSTHPDSPDTCSPKCPVCETDCPGNYDNVLHLELSVIKSWAV